MVAPNYDPKGSCDEGYQGILCADCKPGYDRFRDFQCQSCSG